MQAHDLFASMQKIEIALGRERDPNNQNAPRRIDLDLLLFEDQAINDDQHNPQVWNCIMTRYAVIAFQVNILAPLVHQQFVELDRQD